MLHTVMPPEIVWMQPETAAAPEIMSDGTRHVWLLRGADGRRRIQRLASTEPRDYLDPRWQPGSLWPADGP
jgi:hypothetical protein